MIDAASLLVYFLGYQAVGREMSYTVRLELFEGPLDLLLYLIRKDEIEITDIPIARVTEQYLGHLETLQALELDGAGEYLLMAATLIRIKSRMLLPRHTEDEEDPRGDLVTQLLEYKKYKEAASRFRDLAEERSKMYDFKPDVPMDELRSREDVFTLSFVDLLGALRDVMSTVAEREARHHVVLEEVTIEEKVDLIRLWIQTGERLRFSDLFEEVETRVHAIVTFMAILEMMKLGEVRVFQHGHFAEIWLERKTESIAEEAMAAGAGG
jgi:segregation and condensation protein A